MPDYREQMRYGSLESAYLTPPEPDEPNAYDDWWFALEDLDYEEMVERGITDGNQQEGPSLR